MVETRPEIKSDFTPDELYTSFAGNLDQTATAEILKSLKPTIDYTLSSFDAKGDPLIESRAKLIAAQSIHKFDPQKGVTLPTFVSSQLQQLSRDVRKLRSPVQVPDRTQLERWSLENATREYIEKYGQEPDLVQLADFSGMDINKIKKLREMPKVVSEGAFEDGLVSSEEPDYIEEAMDYIYQGANHRDRVILQHTSGYGGHEILTPKQIADKLNISQSQVSRRLAKMALELDEITNALSSVQ